MKGALVLGLDCGTSAVKAVIWDQGGEAVGEGRAPLSIESPRPGWHEQDADSWVSASFTAIREALSDAARRRGSEPSSIQALSVSHQRETFVPVDRSGRPLRRALLWMDERAGGLLPELAARHGGERFRSITGKALSGNLSLAKIEWLRREEPETFAAAARYLDVHAYLLQALTGEAATGWGGADPTGMFDMASRSWSEEILSGVGLGATRLPEALEPGSESGRLSREASQACGLAEGIPIVVGLGDGQAAGLGCGISGPGESYLSLGTSVVSGTFSGGYVSGKEFRASFHGVPGSYFLETVILSGALTVKWFLERFAPEEGAEARLRAEAGALPPGSEGLLLVPYWGSAMNPYWDAQARGITVGWSGAHGRAHFYRAILEGIALEQRLHSNGVAAALARSGARRPGIDRYVVSGGGAANGLWLRIIADATGRSVQRSRAREAGALGAGMLAASAVGIHPDVGSAAKAMSARESAVIEPDPAALGRYGELFGIYAELYPALEKSTRMLSRFGEAR